VKFALFKWLLRYVSNENCSRKGDIISVWFQKYCPMFRYKYSLEEQISWFCTYMWSIICNMQYIEKCSRRIMAGICSSSPANRLVARVRKVEQYRK
jgi:hypothetical protein